MTGSRTRWLRSSLLALVVVLPACDRDLDRPGGEEGQPASAEVDQVMVQEFQAALQQFVTTPCDRMPLPVGNEMHDCQRLINIVSSQRQFGPLVGVIPNYPNVAQDASFYTTPQIAAWVVNASPDPYTQLGISPGSQADPMAHCLWLHLDAGTWRAALIAIGAGTFACDEPPPPGSAAWDPLRVVPQVYQGAGITDYPNTARWQWTGPVNQADGEQYVGIKCGAAWCAIGRSGFTPQPIPAPGSGMSRERAIPGWHDAQFLAVMFPPGAPNAQLTPGPWGVVYPQPTVPPDWTQFRRVANYDLQAASGPAGGVGTYMQKLYLTASGNRFGSWLELMDGPTPNDPPVARYRNASSSTPKAPLGPDPVQTSPTKHGVTGSARWRWEEQFDETTWVPCSWGCCYVRETA